jgi:hypothetical protein
MTEITINLHDQPCGNCTVCIGRTIGAKNERERIIKLLEQEFNDTWPTGIAFVETSLPNLIALIKGETNE